MLIEHIAMSLQMRLAELLMQHNRSLEKHWFLADKTNLLPQPPKLQQPGLGHLWGHRISPPGRLTKVDFPDPLSATKATVVPADTFKNHISTSARSQMFINGTRVRLMFFPKNPENSDTT
jgi:hypothetical protein